MSVKRLFLGAVIVGVGCVDVALAAPDAGALQQQLQREIENTQPLSKPESYIKDSLGQVHENLSGKRIDVKSFVVTGMTLITQEEAQKVLEPYCNKSLSFGDIKEAGSAIVSVYQKNGYSAQAVIPPQKVIDGVIKIEIIEGKVGEIIIDLDSENPSRLDSSIAQKFISANNPPDGFLSLTGLERSLALLNEVPGNSSTAEITQGAQDKTSNIKATSQNSGFFLGRLDISNYGSNNTGVGQAVASFVLQNPSRVGDQVSVDAIASEGSIYGQIKYGAPLNYDGWRLAAGMSALNYKTLSSFSSTISQGSTQTYGLYSTYALERSARSTKNITLSFENKNYNNLVNQLQSSNYQINNVSLGLNGSDFYNQASINWGVSAVLGNLTINNTSQATNDANGAATSGNFGKIGFNGGISMPLPVERVNASVNFYGQLANKNLTSAEQFYLGGPYGVRAYPVAQGGGSQGAIVSAEVAYTSVDQLQVGAFIDAGLIQQYVHTYAGWQGLTNANNVYPLYATGFLGKYNYKDIQLSATLAFRLGQNPLYNQSGQQLNVSNQYNAVQAWVKGTAFF